MRDGRVPCASAPPLDAASRIAALSPRCRDVLNGIVAGHSSKVIAYELGISPRTVEVHRATLKRRLGARNIAEAIRVAYEAQAIRERLLRWNEPQQDAARGGLEGRCRKQIGHVFKVPKRSVFSYWIGTDGK